MNSDYFVVNPSKAPVRERGANVGREHDAIVSSLNEAMEQLGDVERQYLQDSELSLERAMAVIHLLADLGCCRCRAEVAVKFAEFLAAHGKNVQVRFAVGAGTINRLGDRRLGWLGAESALFEEYSDRWMSMTQTVIDTPSDGISVVRVSQEISFQLSQQDGDQKFVFWIEGDGKQSENAFEWLDPILEVVGQVLWSRPKRKRWNFSETMGGNVARMGAVLSLLAVVFLVWPVPYRVACTATVDTFAQRIIAAPFEATLEQASVRPGDQVEAGELLLTLDGRPLRLELEAVEAEIQQISKEHNAALANNRIAEAQQLKLKQKRLDRNRDLLVGRLANLEVTSPIDGVVISGDLEKYTGAPLERGQTLLEIAPLATVRVELEIPDYEIGYVKRGAMASVKLDAISGGALELQVDDIYPSSELRNDENVFIALVNVENQDGALRPGMLGKAIAYGPVRPRVWSWVRPVLEHGLWWVGY
jgi:multidrug efflux pump subunit AcrA (membrane-fusion protein)